MKASTKPIRAIFEDGVFKPLGQVNLPEGTFVTLEAQPFIPPQPGPTPESKLETLLMILIDKQKNALADRPSAPHVDQRM